MAVVLSHHVDVFDGVTQFSARPALIELTDTNLFSLSKIDPATGAPTEVIFGNVPASEIAVGGSSSTLTFTHNGVKKRVDFSFGSRAAGAFGLAGAVVAANLIKKSGIQDWVAAFKAAGAQVKFWSYGRTMGLGLGIGFGIVIIVVVVVVAVALTSSPY